MLAGPRRLGHGTSTNVDRRRVAPIAEQPRLSGRPWGAGPLCAPFCPLRSHRSAAKRS